MQHMRGLQVVTELAANWSGTEVVAARMGGGRGLLQLMIGLGGQEPSITAAQVALVSMRAHVCVQAP